MNPDSTVPAYDEITRWAICPYCERHQTCDKGESYPIISPLTRYILQYMSEINAGFAMYPLPGSWECQPEWFMSLLNTARAAQTRKERSEAAISKERG